MTLLQGSGTRSRPAFIVGDRLRKARELRGLEKQEFALAIGIHRDTVHKYETNDVVPRLPVLKAWAAETGVDIDWLAYGDGPKPQPSDYQATVSHIRRHRPPARTDEHGPLSRAS